MKQEAADKEQPNDARVWRYRATLEDNGMTLRIVREPRRTRGVPMMDIVPPARVLYAGGLEALAREQEQEQARRGRAPSAPAASTSLERPHTLFRLRRPKLVGATVGTFLLAATTIPLLSAFEAHIVNVTATIEDRPRCETVAFEEDADGNPLAAGTTIDTQYAPLGLTISADNRNSSHPDLAIIFDSDNPTGGDDDLGTPNEDFGGPGRGSGGELGAPGENSVAQHNLLIIPERGRDNDGDGLIDVPDDEDRGGTITFSFAAETEIESIRLFDIEEKNTRIELYDGTDTLLDTIVIPLLGDNSAQTIALDAVGVKTMKVIFGGSAALDDLCFFPIEAAEEDQLIQAASFIDDENASSTELGLYVTEFSETDEYGAEEGGWVKDDTASSTATSTSEADGDGDEDDYDAGYSGGSGSGGSGGGGTQQALSDTSGTSTATSAEQSDPAAEETEEPEGSEETEESESETSTSTPAESTGTTSDDTSDTNTASTTPETDDGTDGSASTTPETRTGDVATDDTASDKITVEDTEETPDADTGTQTNTEENADPEEDGENNAEPAQEEADENDGDETVKEEDPEPEPEPESEPDPASDPRPEPDPEPEPEPGPEPDSETTDA